MKPSDIKVVRKQLTKDRGYWYPKKEREPYIEIDSRLKGEEELADRFIALKMDFYYEHKAPVNVWTRLTLPFAIFVMLGMVISLPIAFLVTGKWGYSLGENNRLLNWFKSLRLQ
jgi:hypothetical protein